jgi:transcriptional regulator with XRE-family HTH domain
MEAAMTKSRSRRKSQSFDHHIAARIRARRIVLGITQESLGKHLGVTFQQIQKYERGTNRISAGRLWQIAKLFNTPIEWFYDAMPAGGIVAAEAMPEPTS